MIADREVVRVGMVGAGFMARVHSAAYRSLSGVYGDALPRIELVRLADIDEARARATARDQGWAEVSGDWTTITRADDIDLVDVATPNCTHAEIAIDAARHGKAILCEKPLAHTLAAAQEMTEAVQAAGVINQVGFVWRRWPAIQVAERLIRDGRLGTIQSFRGHFFHDYALDPALPIGWRMRRASAGAGALADIGSHILDLAHLLVGDISRVMCRTTTSIPKRPTHDGDMVEVDVDDAADLLLEFDHGAVGAIQVNWASAGYKTEIGFDIAGSRGGMRFRWQRCNELEFYSCDDPPELQGYRQIIVGPQHPGAEAFWPVAGLGIGYGEAFAIELGELVAAIATGGSASPDFAHGRRIAQVVDAALRSAQTGQWQRIASTHEVKPDAEQGADDQNEEGHGP